MADMLWNSNKKKSALEMAIMLAKTAIVVMGLGLTVVFASLVVVPKIDLLRSSQSSLWITVQLIIVAIWKLSDARRHGNHPHNHENPPQPPPEAPETWYDVPSSAATWTTTAPPEFVDSLPSSPAEPIIPPETIVEAAASSFGDGKYSMDATWETVADAAESSSGDGNDSMDATWSAIMEGDRSHARPGLKKSPTWERVQNVEAVAEKAAAGREMRKSKTFKEKAKAMVEEGWRRRDVLVVSQDELFRRVETFIKKQHEHLRLQRQESEQRRFLERLRRHSY